ncbi:MAG: lamin tail domain-containing protein [Saprospiraceae bacterium]|nr:lamin tail domain-containing protein [Saprospiraceae bacterium]
MIYTLTMSPQDCDGLPTDIVSTAIARVESPQKNDLVINEILFNPVSGGSDYVELYNRSSKIFSLKDLIIRNELNNQERSITASSLVLPGTDWVLSASPPSFWIDIR